MQLIWHKAAHSRFLYIVACKNEAKVGNVSVYLFINDIKVYKDILVIQEVAKTKHLLINV